MKMIGNLFRELDFTVEKQDAGNVRCHAQLTPIMDCSILKAHFPGQPIVPGACLVAVVGELVNKALKTGIPTRTWALQMQLKTIKNIKFISLIEPREDGIIIFDINIDTQTYKTKVLVDYDGKACCKMSLSYQ